LVGPGVCRNRIIFLKAPEILAECFDYKLQRCWTGPRESASNACVDRQDFGRL